MIEYAYLKQDFAHFAFRTNWHERIFEIIAVPDLAEDLIAVAMPTRLLVPGHHSIVHLTSTTLKDGFTAVAYSRESVETEFFRGRFSDEALQGDGELYREIQNFQFTLPDEARPTFWVRAHHDGFIGLAPTAAHLDWRYHGGWMNDSTCDREAVGRYFSNAAIELVDEGSAVESPDHEELYSPEEEEELVRLRARVAEMESELEKARREHAEDVDVIDRRLYDEAVERSWCSDYDELVESLNHDLKVPMAGRRVDYQTNLTVTLELNGFWLKDLPKGLGENDLSRVALIRLNRLSLEDAGITGGTITDVTLNYYTRDE